MCRKKSGSPEQSGEMNDGSRSILTRQDQDALLSARTYFCMPIREDPNKGELDAIRDIPMPNMNIKIYLD